MPNMRNLGTMGWSRRSHCVPASIPRPGSCVNCRATSTCRSWVDVLQTNIWLYTLTGREAGICSPLSIANVALKQLPSCVQLPAPMFIGLLSGRLSIATAACGIHIPSWVWEPSVCLGQRFNLDFWESFTCVPPGQTMSTLQQKSH